MVRCQLFLRNLPVHACDSRAQGFGPPLARQRSSCPPPSPNLVCTHPVEHYPLLRRRDIKIATKRYATLQAMTPTKIKPVQQTSSLHIESSLDRLGLLSPTYDQHPQQQTRQITLQPALINKSKIFKATSHHSCRNNKKCIAKVHGSGSLELLKPTPVHP